LWIIFLYPPILELALIALICFNTIKAGFEAGKFDCIPVSEIVDYIIQSNLTLITTGNLWAHFTNSPIITEEKLRRNCVEAKDLPRVSLTLYTQCRHEFIDLRTDLYFSGQQLFICEWWSNVSIITHPWSKLTF